MHCTAYASTSMCNSQIAGHALKIKHCTALIFTTIAFIDTPTFAPQPSIGVIAKCTDALIMFCGTISILKNTTAL